MLAAFRAHRGRAAQVTLATGVATVAALLGAAPATAITEDTGALSTIATIIKADKAWKAGWTGKGIDVAVIDTGVAPVPGLAGKVVNGPDLSFDSQLPGERYLDGYGHGTHMASIIAGRDAAATPTGYADRTAGFTGIAPDARIVSLKVGAGDGSVDVSQVIAAIDWVTQHAKDPGMNIRVLNLSYGTNGLQGADADPLAFAVQAAWRKGILVVVSGGNDGTSNVQLANPARDANVLAVGAVDPNGTKSTPDDTVPAFADRGTLTRHVDIVAPGVHVLGLRVPNGAVDTAYPAARVGSRFFRGSGTSQAAAVVSGTAALLLQRNPGLSPTQVKDLLVRSADASMGTRLSTGAGMVDVQSAMSLLPLAALSLPLPRYGTGLGTLDGARGTSRVTANGVALTGERDIFGTGWAPDAWTAKARAGAAWTGGDWNGTAMTGTGWNTTGDWATTAWTGPSWSALSWSEGSWTGRRWADGSWDAGSWTGRRWADASWSGRRWADASWS
jgi:serine protease AprX